VALGAAAAEAAAKAARDSEARVAYGLATLLPVRAGRSCRSRGPGAGGVLGATRSRARAAVLQGPTRAGGRAAGCRLRAQVVGAAGPRTPVGMGRPWVSRLRGPWRERGGAGAAEALPVAGVGRGELRDAGAGRARSRRGRRGAGGPRGCRAALCRPGQPVSDKAPAFRVDGSERRILAVLAAANGAPFATRLALTIPLLTTRPGLCHGRAQGSPSGAQPPDAPAAVCRRHRRCAQRSASSESC
jgi:hypothetical protein